VADRLQLRVQLVDLVVGRLAEHECPAGLAAQACPELGGGLRRLRLGGGDHNAAALVEVGDDTLGVPGAQCPLHRAVVGIAGSHDPLERHERALPRGHLLDPLHQPAGADGVVLVAVADLQQARAALLAGPEDEVLLGRRGQRALIVDHRGIRSQPQPAVLDLGLQRSGRVALGVDAGAAQLRREPLGGLAAGARHDRPPAHQLLRAHRGDQCGRLAGAGLALDHDQLALGAGDANRPLLLRSDTVRALEVAREPPELRLDEHLRNRVDSSRGELFNVAHGVLLKSALELGGEAPIRTPSRRSARALPAGPRRASRPGRSPPGVG